MRRMINTLFVAALVAAAPAHAAFEDELSALQHRWANARYQTSADERKAQLEKLVAEADGLKNKYGDKADSYIWSGVVRGSLAEAINGLGALSIVKEAKVDLEKAIAMDPKAEDSYAYGALGLMYQKVPGWPVGFGDGKKAKETLEKGIQISPQGMNMNYFFASYLFEKGDYKQALVYAEKAKQATPSAPVEIWSGRKKEIGELAEKIEKKLK